MESLWLRYKLARILWSLQVESRDRKLAASPTATLWVSQGESGALSSLPQHTRNFHSARLSVQTASSEVHLLFDKQRVTRIKTACDSDATHI
jgi:hypothetical protein